MSKFVNKRGIKLANAFKLCYSISEKRNATWKIELDV